MCGFFFSFYVSYVTKLNAKCKYFSSLIRYNKGGSILNKCSDLPAAFRCLGVSFSLHFSSASLCQQRIIQNTISLSYLLVMGEYRL